MQTFLRAPLVLAPTHPSCSPPRLIHSLSQFFILIAEWTVHYQCVSDPAVSQGCTVMLQETQKWGEQPRHHWILEQKCWWQRMMGRRQSVYVWNRHGGIICWHNNARKQTTDKKKIYFWPMYFLIVLYVEHLSSPHSSYHCSFRDGAKAVDENITGDVHRWAWGKGKGQNRVTDTSLVSEGTQVITQLSSI